MTRLGSRSIHAAPFDVVAEEARIRAAYAKREHEDARYSWFNPAQQFIAQQRERRVLALLRLHGFAAMASKTVLEIGCGTGQWLCDFIKWGARPENVVGMDLIIERVLRARRLSPSAVRLHCGSATALPFRSETFDVVLQSTVMTSILDARVRKAVAEEMLRVVKPDGLILWYDFFRNNPRNSDVRGIKRREITETLFPNCRVHLENITLAPPIARRLAPYSWVACYVLEKVPGACTHFLGVIQKLATNDQFR